MFCVWCTIGSGKKKVWLWEPLREKDKNCRRKDAYIPHKHYATKREVENYCKYIDVIFS